MRGTLKVVVSDITRLEVDAIVNAANSRLMGGGGVDGAIHRAAGPRLREACAELGGCPTGEARITPGFDLPAEWIVHTVGPVWNGGKQDEDRLLRACYENSCALAREQGVKSIAFPCISTGAYGFPPDRAAAIALEAMDDRREDFERIVVCCFQENDAQIYRDEAKRLSVKLN